MPLLTAPPEKYVHIFFLDGVGLGGPDPEVNPFVTASLPHLTALLGEKWFLAGVEAAGDGPLFRPRATLVATDANMGVAGRPQSATGQATILTGRNVPLLIGEHFGPKPNPAVAEVIGQGSLFQAVVDAGGRAALLTPYPAGFFEAIEQGRRLLSSVPLAATGAGLRLRTADDLRQGQAVSPGFTNEGWRDYLGYTDIPLLTLPAAGRRLASLASQYHFSFFEHWPSDRSGHRGTLAEARRHLEMIDAALGGLLQAWDDDRGLLIVTSDHGNIEAKNQRQHTRNPVPTILVGDGHAELGRQIRDLADIAGVVQQRLGLAD